MAGVNVRRVGFRNGSDEELAAQLLVESEIEKPGRRLVAPAPGAGV